jgi:(2R)-sulfolactate sulfo-lyase subunit beta
LYAAGCTLVFGETTELTGGEQIVAARCRDDKVRKDFMRVFDRYPGSRLTGTRRPTSPTRSRPKATSRAALTTIEEKALGNIQKIGRKCVVDGVLDKARCRPVGAVVHGQLVAAAEMVTLCAASGFRRALLPDGAGQRNRQPDPAVIKICANPRTVRTMSEHVDVDTSGLLQREITMSEAGDQLLDMMFRTANGRLTAAEALGHREFVLTRLYESA